MKINSYILSYMKWILILIAGILVCSCEIKKEPEQNVPSVKPIKNTPVEIKKEEIVKPVNDTITPSDSIHYQNKDTTETFQEIEKKPERKVYKKLYIYSIYKKPLIS